MEKKMISGLVTNIVDGNTFEISVHVEDGDSGIDKHTQKVRIHGRDKPSVSTLSGILAKLELEKKIVGRKVECEILERDELDQIIVILPNKYVIASFPFDSGIKS